MRMVLIIGAGICCIPGLYCSFGIPEDIIKIGIADRTAGFAIILYDICDYGICSGNFTF